MNQEPKPKPPEINIPNLSDIDKKIEIPSLATLDQLSIVDNQTLNVLFMGIPIKINVEGKSGFEVTKELTQIQGLALYLGLLV